VDKSQPLVDKGTLTNSGFFTKDHGQAENSRGITPKVEGSAAPLAEGGKSWPSLSRGREVEIPDSGN